MDEKKILPKCHALAVKKTRTKVVTIDHPETKKKNLHRQQYVHSV